MAAKKNKVALFFSVLFLIIFFDQITKANFVSGCNTGIAFGFFRSFWQVNLVVSFLTLVFLGYFLIKQKGDVRFFALSLIIGGGVSNLLDRIIFGCIRDFIHVWFLPSFNIADFAVTLGVLTFILSLIRVGDSEANDEK